MKITIDKQAFCIVIDNDLNKALGSGFSFLKDNWVITAKHVVTIDDIPRGNLSLSFLDKGNVKAKVASIHPQLDLALLKYEGPSFCKKPLMPGYHEFNSTKNLFMIGYSPENSEVTDLASTVNLIKDFEIEERERLDKEITIHFKAEFSEDGNSGGAILGEGGNVVAVAIQTYYKGSEKYCVATSIRTIMKNIKFDNQWVNFDA